MSFTISCPPFLISEANAATASSPCGIRPASEGVQDKPGERLQDFTSANFPQFNYSDMDLFSLECTLDKPKNDDSRFGSERPNLSDSQE